MAQLDIADGIRLIGWAIEKKNKREVVALAERGIGRQRAESGGESDSESSSEGESNSSSSDSAKYAAKSKRIAVEVTRTADVQTRAAPISAIYRGELRQVTDSRGPIVDEQYEVLSCKKKQHIHKYELRNRAVTCTTCSNHVGQFCNAIRERAEILLGFSLCLVKSADNICVFRNVLHPFTLIIVHGKIGPVSVVPRKNTVFEYLRDGVRVTERDFTEAFRKQHSTRPAMRTMHEISAQ